MEIILFRSIFLRLSHGVRNQLVLETRHNRVEITLPGGIGRIVYIQVELVFIRVVDAGGRITRRRSRGVLQRHPGLENTPELNDAEEKEQQDRQSNRKLC